MQLHDHNKSIHSEFLAAVTHIITGRKVNAVQDIKFRDLIGSARRNIIRFMAASTPRIPCRIPQAASVCTKRSKNCGYDIHNPRKNAGLLPAALLRLFFIYTDQLRYKPLRILYMISNNYLELASGLHGNNDARDFCGSVFIHNRFILQYEPESGRTMCEH